MSYYVNENPYGLILLRDSYEQALAESEEMYKRDCARKGAPIAEGKNVTERLLGVKENVLSGQVGLHLPPRKPHIMVPSEAVRAEHMDNPLWVNYEFLHGEPMFVLGALPFGGFGFGVVDPAEVRAQSESLRSKQLVDDIRGSTRKYTLEVHDRTNRLINDILHRSEAAEYLRTGIEGDHFEELVADLLRDRGFDVYLTSRTGDGGKDIWASTIYDGKRVLALVECKVRRGSRAIDPAIARAVVGTYFFERSRGVDVSCALMVTTSDNVGPATLAIQQEVREFGVKDCRDVLGWLSEYGTLRNGLWLPETLADCIP